MSDGDKLHGYTVKRIADVPDFDLVAVQLTHDSTSAQHLHLARSDSNNAFGYGNLCEEIACSNVLFRGPMAVVSNTRQ